MSPVASDDVPRRRSTGARYGVALAAVAVAALLTHGLSLLIQPSLKTPLFFAAVAVAAWFGGAGPALAAVAASAVALKFFLAPTPAVDLPDLVALATVVFVGLLIAWLAHEKERSRSQLDLRLGTLREQSRLLDLAQVLMRNPEDRITFWSKGAERLYGFTAGEAIGRVSHELLRTVFPVPWEEVRDELLARGEWEGELSHSRRDTSRLTVQSRWVLHRDGAGRPLAVVESQSDISELAAARERLAEQQRRLQRSYDEVQLVEEELRSQNEELSAARQAVEAERQRYRELFDLAPDGYLVTDAAGAIVEANQAAAELLGMPPEALAGTPVETFVAPAERGELRSRLAELAGAGRWELRFHPPGGRAFDASLRVAPAEGDHGRRDLRWLIHDVSEHRRAEEAVRLLAEAGRVFSGSLDFSTTLATAAEFAVRHFADWCLIDLLEGGRFERVAVAHRDPALKPMAERLRQRSRSWDDGSPSGEALRTGSAVLAERLPPGHADVPSDPEGAPGLASSSKIAVPLLAQGELLGVWTFSRTDPARPFGEDDLPVAEELGRRAVQAIANARLYRASERASAAKDRFLATLSHELRTPLTPVLMRISALEGDTRLPAELRSDLAMMRRNVELEARLIDDLLDLTRVTRGKLELRPQRVDLAPLVGHVVKMCCEDASASAGLAIVQDLAAADHRVWGDPSRLTQVLWNLFANAVKFTPAGGTVTVRTRVEATAGGAPGDLVVEVADTGIGFEPGRGEQLFRPFEQADRDITRRYGGLGLGLALSRAIVDQHDGRIEAASAGPGQGATFTVRLPMAGAAADTAVAATGAVDDAAASGAGTMEPPAAAARPLHILLVEDHPDTAVAMAALLTAAGYRVTVAGSVAAARQAAAGSDGTGGEPPDLLISDLGLPDGSGFELMEDLGRRLPLKGIALSGYGMEEDVRKSREAGFAAHLTKPVTFDTLLAAVHRTAGEAGDRE